MKGLVAETPATQLRFLEQAVKAAPQYARAQLAIWEVCTDEEQHERALTAAHAVPAASRFSRRARFAAGLSLMHLNVGRGVCDLQGPARRVADARRIQQPRA